VTTARPTLAAEERTTLGKGVVSLRRQGRLPAVVFGNKVPSRSVSIDAHEFELLRRHSGLHPLIDLRVGSGATQTVLVHGAQIHPVTRRTLHVDLMVVRMTEEMTVDVPVVLVGTALAVERLGGTLVHAANTVKVRALPANLPQILELSVEPLHGFDMTLHVRDLVVPPDVAILSDPDEALVRVVPPRVEEVPVEAAPAEGAEAEQAPEGTASEATRPGEG
jgi:large subunit ribosomal protein L25